LGVALGTKGQLDEAIAAYREAIRLKKDDALAHSNLGHALHRKGQFREALAEVRRGHELGSKNPRWKYPSFEWVRQYERLVELDARLSGFLTGKTAPASPGERVELARLCALKHLPRAAARFYADAFAADPKLADELKAFHRYNAACYAALAAAGQGEDADKLTGKERARLRRQALDWLRADLAAWRMLLEKQQDKVRPVVIEKMRHWLEDPDFASVRGPEALGKLPEGERTEWRRLWEDVEALRQQAAAPR